MKQSICSLECPPPPLSTDAQVPWLVPLIFPTSTLGSAWGSVLVPSWPLFYIIYFHGLKYHLHVDDAQNYPHPESSQALITNSSLTFLDALINISHVTDPQSNFWSPRSSSPKTSAPQPVIAILVNPYPLPTFPAPWTKNLDSTLIPFLSQQSTNKPY